MGGFEKLCKAVYTGYGILEFIKGYNRLYTVYGPGKIDYGAGGSRIFKPRY